MKLSKVIIAYLFGRKKKCNNFDLNNISSILIRPFGFALGDSLIHLAFAEQLRSIYPNLKLGIMAGRNRDLFITSNLFDKIIPCNFLEYTKNHKKWQLLLDFRETYNTPDLIADKILSPETTIIFSKQDKEYYNRETISNYDFCYPFDPNSHVVNHLQTSIFGQYFDLPRIIPKLTIPHVEIDKVSPIWDRLFTLPANLGKTLNILLAPQGNAQLKKQVPPSELAQLLNESLPVSSRIRVLMGYTIGSKEYFQTLKELCRYDILLGLSPPTTLKEYLALSASADIIIGVDSGTVHLACALQKPLLSFYARHNIDTWHPLSNPNTPHLMITASQNNNNPVATENFPIELAVKWLSQQIS